MPADPAAFEALLARQFSLTELDQHAGTVIGLWRDTTIGYVNPAWTRFAQANGGHALVGGAWGIGARYLDAIAAPLLPFFDALLARVPAPDGRLQPVHHEYECSSAAIYRRFNLQVFALDDQQGFLLVHSLMFERSHDTTERPPCSANLNGYRNARGVVVQCCHCRRIQLAAITARWDWVPDWVANPPAMTSHGICSICEGYYYPDG